MDASWLCSADGTAAISLAQTVLTQAALGPGDLLAAGTELRRMAPDLSTEQATAALDQASLRREAERRHGLVAGELLLTRDGLEQATRPIVARARAALLRTAGAQRVLDLTGGLGLDDRAFVDAGLAVTTVERDPDIAALLAHNVPQAEVVCGDATDPAVLEPLLARLGAGDVVFVDPARRSHGGARDIGSGRARPERDPERWSPPWSFVAALPHPRVAVKASPGFDPPPGWHAQWTSVGRVVVECAVFSWPIADATRRALVLASDTPVVIDQAATALPIAATLGHWLIEPDPAVLAAAAESGLRARQDDLAHVDPQSTWLTCDRQPSDDLLQASRAYRVVEELEGSAKDQRRRLRELGIGAVVVKSRDVRRDPAQVLRDLRCTESGPATVILTMRRGRVASILAERNVSG